MRAVYPGRPASKLHAIDTVSWGGRRLISYISGRNLIILDEQGELVQSIAHDEDNAIPSSSFVSSRASSSFSSQASSSLEQDYLTAIAINSISGKVAVSTSSKVFVYTPIDDGLEDGNSRWRLQHTLCSEQSEEADLQIACLSWGPPDELLVAGACLTLYATDRGFPLVWKRRLASPAKFAAFSPDGSLIATTGWHDRLVKIGRRQFLGEGDERFDASYLRHPQAVTGLRWRGRPEVEQHVDAVLYTTCADHMLRIWTATDVHGLSVLQLWVKIDLLDCIQPRLPLSPGQERKRFVVIVDNWEFKAAVETAAHQIVGTERDKHARDHLKEVVSNNPELLIVLDDRGNMSAWGLERVGCKDRQAKDIYNITHIEDLNIDFRENLPTKEQYLTCLSFHSDDSLGKLSILVHFFDGRLEFLECPIDQLLDPSPAKTNRFTVKASWTGHSAPVLDLFGSPNGKFFISRSSGGECIFWNSSAAGSALTASPLRYIRSKHEIQGLYPTNDRRLAVVMYYDKVSLKSLGERIRRPNSSSSSSSEFDSPLEKSPSRPFAHITDPNDANTAYFSMLIDKAQVLIWRSDQSSSLAGLDKWGELKLEFEDDDLVSFPRAPVQEGSIETLACASISQSGTLKTWKVPSLSVSEKRVEGNAWPATRCIETGIQGAVKVFIGPSNILGIVSESRTSFSIWNSDDCYLDFHSEYQRHETIELLDWFSKGPSTILLAVIFSRRVLIFANNRHESTCPDTSWICLNQIDVSQLTTLPISTSLWLANGHFLIAAGNQMFLFDQKISPPTEVAASLNLPIKAIKGSEELLNIASALSHALPVYHPSFLTECVLAGKLDLTQTILIQLSERLKYHCAGDDFDTSLGLDLATLTLDTLPNGFGHRHDARDSFTEESGASLSERIASLSPPFLVPAAVPHLLALIISISRLSKYISSLDALSRSYLIHLFSISASSSVSWREACLALFTQTSTTLMPLIQDQFPAPVHWRDVKRTSLPLFAPLPLIAQLIEDVARSAYNETKNPVDCSLFYLALRKKTILSGLWRLATWNKERSATIKLLANNFSDTRWRTSALKNAYALLGRQRFTYAAAFFLLADHLQDAVNVLVTQVGDLHLAIAIARVYENVDGDLEGKPGPVLRMLLEERVLPSARHTGDRWCNIWALSVLGRKDDALGAFVDPISDFRVGSELRSKNLTADSTASSWVKDEPCLVHIYAHARNALATTLPPWEEYILVRRSANGYRRMGCYSLALNLVRSWSFSPLVVSPISPPTNGHVVGNGEDEAEKDTSDVEEEEQQQQQQLYKKHNVPVPVEPSAASILDNFDF